MASWIKNMRQNLTRQPEPNTAGASMNPQRNGSPSPSPTGYSQPTPPLSHSSSYSSQTGPSSDSGASVVEKQVKSDSKYFFQPRFAKLGVKGNFMPLAAQPANADLADWLAHQTVENYRVVATLAKCIQETNGNNDNKNICNAETCPTMTAGHHTYTWLDNNKQPVSVTAAQYIGLVQRWMNGKIHDPRAFPTADPKEAPSSGSSAYSSSGNISNTPTSESSNAAGGPTTNYAPLARLAGRDWFGKSTGFPETFLHDVRTCFRQIFRIYAHLYHSHWVEPFWHISGSSNSQGWTNLNSCFVHFCTVAKLYGLLSDKDAAPMQPLIDIWIANGSIPADAANSACSVVS